MLREYNTCIRLAIIDMRKQLKQRKKLFRQTMILFCVSTGIVGCSIEPRDYTQQTPTFDFQQFLQGDLTGWGVYQNRSGLVTKRFRIDMRADWQGDVGKFTENFTFNDGSKQVREWVLTKIDANHYTGKANDSVGLGTGELWGNTLHWDYTILTETDGGTYALDYDYWMYLIDENTLMNRATLSKFGVKLGDIFVTFHKNPSNYSPQP